MLDRAKAVVRSWAVSGQAHTPWRRSVSLVLAAIAVLAAPAAGDADAAQRAGALRAESARIETQTRSAVLGLYTIDSGLAGAQTRLSPLEAQAAKLRRERRSLALELSVARRSAVVGQRRLAARIRALYEQGGDISTIEILLGAEDLDAAVSGIDALDRVRGQDEDVLAQLGVSRVRLASASTRLAAREHRLSAAVRAAKATAFALARARADRSAYLARLRERDRLNTAAISALETQARIAQARTRELTRQAPEPAAPAVSAPAPAAVVQSAQNSPSPGGRTLTVSASGYALTGATATGISAGWGVAAVDPSVIPLGTHMTIPGYGEAVAADTGGAVVGTSIDLWFPTVEQAQAWGRRVVTVVVGG